ncbi:MAG: efflux RND transporter periplasmic adaptor subunit [Nitrospirae bacterium]|nr:efflux RND transporter periplasmic adaptor subunit [Nitrospirota bacterium]
MKNKAVTIIYLLFTALFVIFPAACSKDAGNKQVKIQAVPVMVEVVRTESVPLKIKALGTVEAYSTVDVTPRATGEVTSVSFDEGDNVKEGQLLFTIDPAPYQTALEIAEANLMRDMAISKKAEGDFVRYDSLFIEKLVSRNDMEKMRTNADAAAATIVADRAAVEKAKLELGYCFIHSPASGRTGSLLVNKGNTVRANEGKPMVVINQIQPVYVSFSVPERNLSEIRRYMSSEMLNVGAFLSKEDKIPEQGILTFIDNSADASTGTIRMKASFENKELALWPGQFVDIAITLSTIGDALVLPSHALQTGQQGQFVFVIKDDTAELRPVSAGITHEGMTVIEDGLAEGEQVVTDGQMMLMPGAKVEIKNK